MSYNVNVLLNKTDTALDAGVAFAGTHLTVTDSNGAVQTFSLTGVESPAWSQAVTVASDGASQYSAQDVDTTGANIGSAVTATYTPQGATFPATSSLTVTPA